MIPTLNDHEVRVLGALMEKAVITPDVYPLTLNALTNACNQKNSRDPVTSLSATDVARAARDLEAKSLVKREENFRNGVEKFQQRFCNTPFSAVKLDAQEYGVLCLLLLRGAQTPGELRARAGRLCSFATNEEAAAVLQRLIDRPGGPLVARLPRRAGRQDHEYVHLLAGEVVSVAADLDLERPAAGDDRLARIDELQARIDALEAEVAALRSRLGER